MRSETTLFLKYDAGSWGFSAPYLALGSQEMPWRILMAIAILITARPASAFDCDETRHSMSRLPSGGVNEEGSVVTVDYLNGNKTKCVTFIYYFGEHRRLKKTEILDGKSILVAYQIYQYLEDKPTYTRRDERVVETYLPNGTLLLSTSPDGTPYDANGDVIDSCRDLQFRSHLPNAWFPSADECDKPPNMSLEGDGEAAPQLER